VKQLKDDMNGQKKKLAMAEHQRKKTEKLKTELQSAKHQKVSFSKCIEYVRSNNSEKKQRRQMWSDNVPKTFWCDIF
jgi:hypothetical protein